jgi:putative DNA methylase
MGALLDAAVLEYGQTLTVADPFSGGGTVTFEAARRGLKAYAQDLYPWPARGLASALSTCGSDLLASASQRVLEALEPLRQHYRTAAGVELCHVLRVRTADCAGCNRQVFEFPHALVSVASRGIADHTAYFGCRACGEVSLRDRGVASFKCDGCDVRWKTAPDPFGCPHCSHAVLVPRSWHAVLVQELVQVGRRLKAVLRKVQDGDPVDYELAGAVATELSLPIQPGKETKRLLDNGFECWGDLYTRRQAESLAKALTAVRELDADSATRDRLAFCVLGAAEMPAFLSRWDRFNLKPFEGMANHRYTQTTLAVESNLLSPVGRGTLPRRLESAAQALDWLIEAQSTLPKVVTSQSGRRGRKRTDWDVMVTTGSSVRQELRDKSVSVVITDPPYFDDVQYGELARLFHTWLRIYDPTVVVDESGEAVPNAGRGVTADDYEQTIAACLAESRRTLKADGRLVLTFHNKKFAAWRALAGAIGKAGFEVSSLAAVLAENHADHCKRNVNAMLHDLVIECVIAKVGAPVTPKLVFRPTSLAEKNLAAIGLALAHCAKARCPEELQATYLGHLEAFGAKTRLIGT